MSTPKDPWTAAIVLSVVGLIALWMFKKSKQNQSSDNNPCISLDEERLIQDILNNNPTNKVIAIHQKSSLHLKQKDFCTLQDGQWLNDEVINFYIALLMDKCIKSHKRILFFNSFFYTRLIENGYNYNNVRRWTRIEKLRKKGINGVNNIFELDKIIFPINLSNIHWSCGCLNFKDKTIEYYDSMNRSNDQNKNHFFKTMRQYLYDEYKDKINGNNLNLNEWINENGAIAQQQNGNDCGVFTVKCAQSISNGSLPTFTQRDIPYFRQRIMIDILNGAVS